MHKFQLFDKNTRLFDIIKSSTLFEEVSRKRQIANVINKDIELWDQSSDNHIVRSTHPLVRSTTPCNLPAQEFTPVHSFLVAELNSILQKSKLATQPYNNLMIEIYNDQKDLMAFHSDMSLDLDPEHLVAAAVFSENPPATVKFLTGERAPVSCKFLTQSKDRSNPQDSAVNLVNGQVVLFDTEWNKLNVHRFESAINPNQGRTMIVTFRVARTFIKFDDYGRAFLANPTKQYLTLSPSISPNIESLLCSEKPFTLVTEEQKRELFNIKGRETRLCERPKEYDNFPPVTISKGDLIPPVKYADRENNELDSSKTVCVLIDSDQVVDGFRKEDFFGVVVESMCDLEIYKKLNVPIKTVYFCGNLVILPVVKSIFTVAEVFVVKDFFDPSLESGADDDGVKMCSVKNMPKKVHGGIGVYVEKLIPDTNLFGELTTCHAFSNLTESNKDDVAFRTGVYISDCHQVKGGGVITRLLRCSTNFKGSPTQKMYPVDWKIFNAAEAMATSVFIRKPGLNHSLAQVYHNVPAKNKTAKISAHSDKKKDMDIGRGILAFFTTYKQQQKDFKGLFI